MIEPKFQNTIENIIYKNYSNKQILYVSNNKSEININTTKKELLKFKKSLAEEMIKNSFYLYNIEKSNNNIVFNS